MKKKIFPIFATTLLSFFFIFSSSNVKDLKEKKVDFVQNAKAAFICEDYYFGMNVCCKSGGTGCPIYNGQDMEGPYYFIPD
jgi:hypothetical protein